MYHQSQTVNGSIILPSSVGNGATMVDSRIANAATADLVEPLPRVDNVRQHRKSLEPPYHQRTVRYTKKRCEDNSLSGGSYNYADSLTLDLEENESAMANRESGGGCKYEENYSCGFTGGCRSSKCQPCGPSPKSILKKRSCCQCITGYCMCQPTPRSCNCPPPVQVDARADRECSCDCPSSPECSCPPSERRFPRAKIKCPNARLCCPLPRLPPGPKCQCVQCQPCLPPPCDPCTSSKCCTKLSRANPCRPSSPCRPTSPCRLNSPSSANSPFPSCRPTTPAACASCRKVARPCGECEEAHYGPPYARTANQSQTLSRPTSPVCKGTGQSVSPWITINESTGDVGGCEGMLLINEQQEGLQPSHRSCDAKDQCHRNCRSHCSAAREIIERVDFDEGASDARDSSLNLTRNRKERSLGTEEPRSVSSNATAQTLKSGVNVSFQVRSKERARNARSREMSPKRVPDSGTRSSSPTRVAATSTDKEQSNPKAAIVRARSPLDARRRQTATQAYFPFRTNLQIQRNS